MPRITEGSLQFDFPESWRAEAYDSWSFYRRQFQNICDGVKGIDILAIAPNGGLWLIEVKDYRQHRRTKPSELSLEVAQKVRDTLAGLLAAAVRAKEPAESDFAKSAVKTTELRVVLHLEQPEKPSKLFPKKFNLANLKQDLKRQLKSIDPHPLVVDCEVPGAVPWQTASQSNPSTPTESKKSKRRKE